MTNLSIVQAQFLSIALIKINAARHELGQEIDYLHIGYSKTQDAVVVEFERDAAISNAVSLKKAEYVSWFVPQIRSLETDAIKISNLDFVFDRVNDDVQLEIILENVNDVSNE